jgi:hypothetical protein
MIRLGLRLTLASGREAAVRLIVITVAVALGAGLLVTTVAGMNAVGAQNARNAWLNASAAPVNPDADPAWWLLRGDYFDGERMGRVDVAATGPDSPVPPGIPRLPGPGEFYASPALSELLRTTPAAELGDRFPGPEIGTIGRSALPAPDSLIAIVGHGPAELAGQPGVTEVTSIPTDGRSRDTVGLKTVLAIVSVALLFPVLMFIGTATRLAAARREQRFAAMRLVGATPRQVSAVSAIESAVAAVVGAAAGFGLFYLFRPLLAEVPFTGERFFVDDLSVGVAGILLVGLGIPAGAVLAALLALRRVRISPLGVSRGITRRPPRAWRLAPAAMGLGALGYFVGWPPESTEAQIFAYLSAVLLVMVGLTLAGPWLTMLGSRLLAGRARRPAALIAGRRLADNPHAAFRAVSGLMLALFVTSVATGAITTFVAERGAPPVDSVRATSLAKTFWPEERAEGDPGPSADAIPAGRLAAIPGVENVTVVHQHPFDQRDGSVLPGVIACAALADTPAYGGCAGGAEVAEVFSFLVDHDAPAAEPPVWPTASVPLERLPELPVLSVVVDTDGSAAAIEQARTLLATTFPRGYFPGTIGESDAAGAQSLRQWQQLANVVILASLPIAGCSLAVSVAGGLTDRRRPFSLLRLTGVPLGVLRRVVLLESAVPLVLVAALAIGTGLLAAHLFLTSQLDYSLRPPELGYYLVVVGGLVLSLGIIATTLPLLRRVTGPEAARAE